MRRQAVRRALCGVALTSDGKGVFQWDNSNQSTYYIWGDQGPQYQIVNYADNVEFGLTGYFWTTEKVTLNGNIKYLYSEGVKDKAKEITLPESVLVIGGFETFRQENDYITSGKFGAFQNWTALQSITVSKNVRTINPYAFAGCELT